MNAPKVGRHEMVYHWLLWFYPRSLRTEHGREMAQVFDDLVRERGRRASGLIALDLAVSVPRTRLEAIPAWAAVGWPAKLWHAGIAGRGAVVLLFVAPAVYLLSWVIEFAIFGTLALGLGLILLAVAMWRRQLSDRVDRVLVAFAAVGSLTWNTETLSAFLLVGVGLVFVVLSLRLRKQHEQHREPEVPR